MAFITIESSTGTKHVLKRKLAAKSGFLGGLVNFDDFSPDDPIPVFMIDDATLKMVCNWLEIDNKPFEIKGGLKYLGNLERLTDAECPKAYVNFIHTVDWRGGADSELFKLFRAADYLAIPTLVELCAMRIASRLVPMPPYVRDQIIPYNPPDFTEYFDTVPADVSRNGPVNTLVKFASMHDQSDIAEGFGHLYVENGKLKPDIQAAFLNLKPKYQKLIADSLKL